MFRRQAGKGTAIGASLRLISLRPTLLKDLPMSSAYIIVDTLITNDEEMENYKLLAKPLVMLEGL
jgi:hypothetical protein